MGGRKGDGMKAITLTQPWATLVATGAKQIETRSWSTSYRGPLAIHAAKGLGPVGGKLALEKLCNRIPFRSALAAHLARVNGTNWLLPTLPLGAVVAVVELYDIQPIIQLVNTISDQERAFGDYSAGRCGWLLRNAQMLPAPVACSGALGLWTLPAGVQEQVANQCGVTTW
jgi:hypothetical protein